MNNKIYITRHGQDIDNAKGILNGRRNEPLTDIGLNQAHDLAQKIKDQVLMFDAVLSSPLVRAYDTASVITDLLEMKPPIKEDLLIEREFGVMTGKPVSSILELCLPDVIETDHINYFLSPDGAETFEDLLNRSKQLLNKLATDYSDKDLLLVTHGDIGKMIYAKYYDVPWQDVLKNFHFGNTDLLLLSPDSPASNTHVFQAKQYHKSK